MYEQFDELPASKATAGKERWAQVADAARAAEGAWVLVGDEYSSYAAIINSGRLAAFRPKGHFKAATRNSYHEEGKGVRAELYVRYINPEDRDTMDANGD